MEILCNSLAGKDLLAELGTISYYHGVTEAGFWQAVGRTLASKRKEKGITALAIEKGNGPTNKTVQDIEAGRIGQLSKLREYATVVGVDLVDLFRAVLTEDDEDSEELQFVIRQFKSGGVDGRAAFVSTAKVVERAQQAQHTPPKPKATPSTQRAPNATAKRRGGK